MIIILTTCNICWKNVALRLQLLCNVYASVLTPVAPWNQASPQQLQLLKAWLSAISPSRSSETANHVLVQIYHYVSHTSEKKLEKSESLKEKVATVFFNHRPCFFNTPHLAFLTPRFFNPPPGFLTPHPVFLTPLPCFFDPPACFPTTSPSLWTTQLMQEYAWQHCVCICVGVWLKGRLRTPTTAPTIIETNGLTGNYQSINICWNFFKLKRRSMFFLTVAQDLGWLTDGWIIIV